MTRIDPAGAPLAEYAQYWLRHHALEIERPLHLEWFAEFILDVEQGRPGFSAELRNAAIRELEASSEHTRSAVAALAIVGRREDIPLIRTAGDLFGARIAKYARTAVFEIRRRSKTP